MTIVKTKMVEGGRLVVPAAFRKAMGVAPGDTLVLELDGDELRVRTSKAALRRLQARLRALVPPGVSVVDEFIADRRAEAARE